MNPLLSIRPFIGAKDFNTSITFYTELGFEKVELSRDLCLFQWQNLGFYLQNAYVKEWIDNTMIFVEVENVALFYEKLLELQLPEKFQNVRVEPIRTWDWGSECYVHDPSGILWHFGTFHK